jgi:C-terminal peptidase prc
VLPIIPAALLCTSFLGAPAIDATTFAQHVLATADLVLQRHVEPPTRQAMIVGAISALHEAANRQRVWGIGRTVSRAMRDQDLQQLLEDAWREAHKSGDKSDEQLQAAAIEGLFRQVPEHPQVAMAKEARVQEQFRGNRYVGIGIQLGMEKQGDELWPQIIATFSRGPARVAGAQSGDRILEVDGVSTAGRKLEEVVDMLRGDEGSTVTIVVQLGDADRRQLTMTRGVVPFDSITGLRRVSEEEWEYRTSASDPIAYIQFMAIRASTLSELRRLVPRLESEGIRALILDLRNMQRSDGVDVQHAALVADELLDEGPIGRLVDANGSGREFRSGPDCAFRQWPIVVLVNRGTSGEGEFIAAALQDNRRAVVVGEPTRGNAFARSPVELPDGLGTVVLRTGVLLRADGRPLQNQEDNEALDETRDHRLTGVAGPPIHDKTNAGSVWPDQFVGVTAEEFRQLMRWRAYAHSSDTKTSKGGEPANDTMLDKAIELLRASLRSPQ